MTCSDTPLINIAEKHGTLGVLSEHVSRAFPDGVIMVVNLNLDKVHFESRRMNTGGYMIVYVEKGHHQRRRDRMACEHRIIMEIKLGRRLKKGEMVHHINGIRHDNRPENLEVYTSQKAHYMNHRPPNCKRRKFGESNPLVKCKCGCGESFRKYDNRGCPREYILGHTWKIVKKRSNQHIKRRELLAEYRKLKGGGP